MVLKLVLVLAVVAVLAAPVLALPPGYEFVDLGYRRVPRDINNAGQVVGSDWSGGGTHYACTWINGQESRIGPPGGGTDAKGVNEAGDIIGDYASGGSFFYDHATQQSIIDNHRRVVSHGINNAGQYILNYSGSTARVAYFGSAAEGFVELGYLNPDVIDGRSSKGSQASAVNNLGQVIGYSHVTSSTTHNFWWENNVMTDLGFSVGVMAMNDHGQVTGGVGLQAFLWVNGQFTYLHPEAWLGCDINNSGVIVGEAQRRSDHEYYAFAWQAGDYVDLNQFAPDGFRLQEAYAVNDLGQIVGTGWADDGWHGYLLNPIPEPATVGLVALGLAALAARRGRQRR